MKNKNYKRILGFLCAMLSAALVVAGCSSQTPSGSSVNSFQNTTQGSGADPLVPSPIAKNLVVQNPYLAKGDSLIHNDSYSSDVTNTVMPIGIDYTLGTSLEATNEQAPSAAFYDSRSCAFTPFLGGIAITDMTGDVVTRSGSFVPSRDDNDSYSIQVSYSFIDADGNVVVPTSHGHIMILKTRDDSGKVLTTFEKILDVDVSSEARKVFGNDIDTNLLSIIYDYQGNLWFVTGGFRIYPDRNPAGFMGYLSREYIDKAVSGEEISLEDNLFFSKLKDGEGAENGISSNEDGAVILTNTTCYMLGADNGVHIKWQYDYESAGVKSAGEGSDITGEGLAWGSGTTPTLTNDLVLFTDNTDTVNLIALSSKTGDEVAKPPVLDGLPEGTNVSVENSILVYSGSEDRVSVVVCNRLGAGNSGLSDPDAYSLIQTYDNIYDKNWTDKGNAYIAPGIERVDIIKNGDKYKAEKVWLRDDISNTSMIKLSTATGYLYGYWQNLDTGMWCCEILDFETGKTVKEIPVSAISQYNNMAVGVIADPKGNTFYCPTNNMCEVRLQDVFAYIPSSPATNINPDCMERYYLDESEFSQQSNTELKPSSYLMKVTIQEPMPEAIDVAFKVNGLDKMPSDYTLFTEDKDGKLVEVNADEWCLTDDKGNKIGAYKSLSPETVYNILITVKNTDDTAENGLQASAILASK